MIEKKTNIITMKGPKGHFIFGSLKEFRAKPLEFCSRMESEYDGFCKLNLGPIKAILLHDPELIKEVLVTQNKSFGKGAQYKEFKHFLNNGLLTSEGETWFKQRRLIQPTFYKKSIASFFEIMVRSSNSLVDRWDKDEKFEALPAMNLLTLSVIGEVIFGYDISNNSQNIDDHLSFINQRINSRVWNLINVPIWFPSPKNKKFKNSVKVIDDLVFDLIKKRRNSPGSEADLTQMLIDVEDQDTKEKMNDQEVRDELMTIFAAGHETSAVGLTWALYLIGKNKKAEEKIVEELGNICPNNLTIDAVWKLEYIGAVIKEAMRMYPPVWVFGRVSIEPVKLRDFEIDKGQVVITSPYAMHHSEKHWVKPEEFNPDRFMGEQKKSISKYAYFPFSGGPRICIGEQFAIMEMIIAIATIYKAGKPVLIDDFVEKSPFVTLRPSSNIKFDWIKKT
jgi:cytochrome P450|tara:strand:- start:3678 stop:5024 length:1347 start_codon:yes stop_codon:yes gene_type:complete